MGRWQNIMAWRGKKKRGNDNERGHVREREEK